MQDAARGDRVPVMPVRAPGSRWKVRRRAAAPEPAPVFVDPRGRRRRWLAFSGTLLAAACLVYAALILVSLTAEPVQPAEHESKPSYPPIGETTGRTPAEPVGM